MHRLFILGGCQLLDPQGRELAAPSRKARALLSLVALSPLGVLPRERVAGLLWGDADEAHARQSLRQTLSDLRRAAGPLLAVAGGRLELDASCCSVDALEFAALAGRATPDALERAAGLYRGPLLDGLTLDDAPEFEDWLQLERQRHDAMNRAALAALLARHAQAGDTASVLRVAERAVAFDPADEPSWRLLMQAHHDTGRAHLSVLAFERCCDGLRRRLDATPSAETVALLERLRATPPGRAWQAAQRPVPAGSLPTAGPMRRVAAARSAASHPAAATAASGASNASGATDASGAVSMSGATEAPVATDASGAVSMSGATDASEATNASGASDASTASSATHAMHPTHVAHDARAARATQAAESSNAFDATDATATNGPAATARFVPAPAPGNPSAIRSPRRLPVVAVMPIDVLAPVDPAIAAVLVQALVGALARIAGFSAVAGRMLFRGVDFGSDEGRRIAREHNVAFLLTGMLERGPGDAFRLSIQLLDGADGGHLWSRRVELDDLSAARRDELVAGTVARIEPQIVVHRAAAHRAGPEDADDPWRQVREASAALFAHGWSEEAVETAVGRFRAAIRADPDLALAHAQMSLVLAIAAKMGLVDAGRPLEEAREAAERAIALAPTDSEVLGCAGCAISDLGDPRRGEPLLERAVEENPDNPQAWAALGACRLSLARVEAGLQSLERGVRIGSGDYRRAVWLTLQSRGMLSQRRIDDAIEAARTAVRSDGRFYPGWIALAAAQFRAGKRLQATGSLAQARRIRPRLTLEEAHPWVGPRMASRLREVWPGDDVPQAGRAARRPGV